LVGAIAAGNCVVLKPSEMAKSCESLITKLISDYLDGDCFHVIQGDYKVAQDLLKVPWNKIFFTGSTRVGKIVLKAAAENLTPVCLELGGKSPVIVDDTVKDLNLLSKRLVWGKMCNAGQTCIAPDYVLCHESLYEDLIKECSKRLVEFYGDDPKSSPDFGRIISRTHCTRLKGLLSDFSGRTIAGGSSYFEDAGSDDSQYFPPTILADVSMDSKLMQEEIFGPILPIMKIKNIVEAVEIVNNNIRSQPLAMYLFSQSRKNIDYLSTNIQAGGILTNDTLFGAGSSYLPFGGVGKSGLGRYHGKDSYNCFSHQQSILRRHTNWWLEVPFRFPPYTSFGLDVFSLAATLPAQPHISSKLFLGTTMMGLLIYYACRLYI
jgi:aldehyde dehydrogenase (NAD+)